MKVRNTALRALGTMTLAATVALVGAGSASAAGSNTGSYTWNDCFGGYTGSSMYSGGVSYASTFRSGGCGYVAAALRYQVGQGSFLSSTGTSITTSRAAVAYGGWHWSRSNGAAVYSTI